MQPQRACGKLPSMQENTFEGRVALVTGAGEGIGAAIATQLLAHGSRVVINDVVEARADALARKLDPSGQRVVGIGGDAGEISLVRGMVDFTIKHFGTLDLLVANAGITAYGDFFEFTEQQWDQVTGVNLRGTTFLVQAAAQHMRQRGQGGRIVMMSSITAHRASKHLAVYGMTKAALEALARNLAIELGPHGITINCVAPGPTVTPRNLADDPEYATHWAAVAPMRAALQPDDIADTVLHLLSPAARHITGQCVVVDAGVIANMLAPELNYRKV